MEECELESGKVKKDQGYPFMLMDKWGEKQARGKIDTDSVLQTLRFWSSTSSYSIALLVAIGSVNYFID